jgi:hypothetical protein
MGRTCGMHNTRQMQLGWLLENLNEYNCIEDLSIDGLDRLAEKVLVSQRDAAL